VNREQQEESLADYVRRIRHEKDLSLADVSNRSGGGIGRTHINRIENGEAHGVSVEKLRALAKGLGVSEEEIFAVARGKSSSGDLQLKELRLLEYYRLLSEDRQDDVLLYLEMLSGRRSAMGRAKDAKLPISSIFSQGARRGSKKRAG
jgi:transcriptional regulator with XRE-family HTH domain